MLISSFVYAYSLKKRDVMTLMIAFLDAVNWFILSIIYIAFLVSGGRQRMGSKGANKSFDYNLIKILDAVILSGNAAMAAKS